MSTLHYDERVNCLFITLCEETALSHTVYGWAEWAAWGSCIQTAGVDIQFR